MADYFIPLSVLLPSGLSPFSLLPILLPPLDQIGVRKVRETWNDTHFVLSGEAVLGEDTQLNLGFAELLVGHGSGGGTVMRFELAAARRSVADLIVANGEELFGVDESVLENESAMFQAFWRIDGPCPSFRLAIHDISARLRFPESFRKGELVHDTANEVVGIEPLEPPQRVEFTLVSASLIIDTERGISLQLDPDQAIDVPPFVIGDTGVGLQVDDLKVDFSTDSGIPEVLTRPGYDETWQGVYIGTARLLGLDSWVPFFPQRVELSQWLLGSDGITGTLELVPTPGVGELGPFKLDSLTLEIQRTIFIRGVFETTFRWSAISNDLADWHDLKITFTVRHNPGVPDAIGFDISVRSVEEDPDALFTFTKEMLAVLEGAIGLGLIFDVFLDASGQQSVDQALVATLLLIASGLQAADALVIEEIKILKVTARYFTEEINAHRVRFVDVVVDGRGRLSIDLPFGGPFGAVLPRLKTERPIGVEVRGFTVRVAVDVPEGAGDVQRVGVLFDPKSRISFDVGEQSLIENTPLVIVKAGCGKWDEGVWFDLGLKLAMDCDKMALSVVPAVIRLWFLSDGTFDHASFEGGVAFSLLIPSSVYVKGRLEWSEDVRIGTGRAFLLRKSMEDHEDRANWVWDLEMALRQETRDGVSSVVGSLEITNSEGWPFSGSTSLYGLSGLLGMNARPAVLDPAQPDYVRWYREQPPANRVIATKWALADGSEAAAFGVVIGSADGGRAWSAKVAIIYASGVIIIPGTLNILSKRPKLADQGKGTFDMVLVADWEHDIYAVSIRFDYRKPEDGKLLRAHVPLDLYWRKSPKTWHAWVGQHMPEAARVGLKVLDKFEGGFYVMLDRESIANLGGSGVDIPGTAKVFGGAAAFKWQLGKGRVKVFVRAGLELHVGFGEVPNAGNPGGDADLTFFGGALRIIGGVGVKVFGMGFEFQINADMVWMTPEPSFFDLAIKVKIGLPWPIPDISVTVHATKGADGPLREPGHLCAGLSLHSRSRNAPVALQEGAVQADVPIDAAFTLTFAFPVRNAMGSVGSFNFSSVNTSVNWPMSGEKGYAVELQELTLWVEDPGGVLAQVAGPFPAIWLDGLEPGPGGEPSRKILQLFAYDGVMVSRYVGATADYVDSIFEGFDPCPRKPPEPICYGPAALTLGPLAEPTTMLSPPDERPVRIASIPAPPGAETVRRFGGLEATGIVVEDLTFMPAGQQRAVMLPATYGANLPGPGASPMASNRLGLEWSRARTAELSVLRIGGFTRVAVRFFDGDVLVKEDVEGVVVGLIMDKAEDVRFRCELPTTRAEVVAFQQLGQVGGPNPQTAFYRACLLYEADVGSWEDAMATSQAWSQLWSDLFTTNAATSSALLLQPGRRYTLEAKLQWLQVEGTTETPGGQRTHRFRFDTVPIDRPPLDRLRPTADLVDQTSWDVDSTPADGAATHYRLRGITLRMRDPRLDSVYKTFGRRLVLRVIDDKGIDLYDRLAFLAEHASEMPEYQEVFSDIVLNTDCPSPDHAGLWSIGVAHFGSLLETDRGYEASLVPVPDPNGNVDLSTVDWKVLPAIHSFRFRTSRWDNLAAHVQAHARLDEILDGSPDLSTIDASVPTAWDDGVLEQLLHATLGAVHRPPAASPELVRLWRTVETGTATKFEVVGLLLDGPEPVAGPTMGITVKDANAATVPVALRAGASGTRALLLFHTGGSVQAAPPGTLTVGFADGVETAAMDVAVDVTPAFLVEEMAP